MSRPLWLLVAVGAAVLAAATSSASAEVATARKANASSVAAAPFASAWANVPRTTAARRAKSVLVFGMEQDVAGFNTNDADQTSLWASITGIEPVIRGTYIIDNNGNYKLDLASKVSATSKDFTITLRPDAFWNWGGKKIPVTNQDIAYTWKQFTDPNNDVASITGYDQIGSYTLKGAKTIVFHWRTSCPPGTEAKGTCSTGPFADYRDLFAGPLGIMPSKASAGLDFNKMWADCVCGNDGKPVSDGPFMVTNYTRGQGLTLKPNPFWYGTKPGLTEIDFKLITDTNSEIQAMRGGEVDAIYPSPQTALSELIHQSGLTYSSISGFTQEHWDINTQSPGNPLLRNQWMREAIALAINRHSLISALYGQISPGQKPINNLEYELGPNATGANAHFAKWATAPGKAIALLKAHCTGGPTKPTRDNSATWSCNGQPAAFNFYTTAGNQRRETSAAIFTQQLAAVGIKLNVNFEPANPNFFGTRLPAHNFDLAEYAWVGGPDPSGFDSIYTCGGGQNYKQYCNKQVDALIHAGDRELNPVKRTADYEKADSIISNEIPVIPLYSPPNILVYNSAIKGMGSSNNPTQEGPTWNAELWHW